MRTKLPPQPAQTAPALSPEQIEERKLEANAAIGRIKESLKSLEQAKKSLIAGLAKRLGIPREKDENRAIWHALVQYANADLRSQQGLADAVKAFDFFTFVCVNQLADSLEPENPLTDLSPFNDLKTQPTRMAYQLKVCKLQQQVREMLTWLADPNGCASEVSERALRFLMEHGGKDALSFDTYPNDEFDDGDNGLPLFYWKMPLDYKTILTPVATFILQRIDKYQQGDLQLAEAVPLIKCRRIECGTFAVPLRKTKDFCSDSCRALYRQKTQREDWARYMKKYRAENF